MSLPLSDIVNVKAEVSAMSAPRKEFNIGLLIGSNSTVNQDGEVVFYSRLALPEFVVSLRIWKSLLPMNWLQA